MVWFVSYRDNALEWYQREWPLVFLGVGAYAIMKYIRVFSAVRANVRINRLFSRRAGLLPVKKSSKPRTLRKSRE